MDVSMQSTCGQNVVEGLSGGGLEWWKLKLDKAIRISLIIYSSFPFCSPLWFALSIVVDTRKNTNLFFFIPMLMFEFERFAIVQGRKQTPTSSPRQKGRILAFLLYEKHFLHNPTFSTFIKCFKLIRRKVYTFNLIFWHNSVLAPTDYQIWDQKLLGAKVVEDCAP